MSPVALEPARDLYGGVLFHTGRFRRVRGYRRLASDACIAEVERDGTTVWFGRYTPGELLLGDHGRRDATIHAIQACVPDATILPVGVGRLEVASRQTAAACFVHARERAHDGESFTYDVEVTGADGSLWERSEGPRLRVIGGTAFQGRWAAPLLGPYVERRVRELIPGTAVAVTVEQDARVTETNKRRARSDTRPTVFAGSAPRLLLKPTAEIEPDWSFRAAAWPVASRAGRPRAGRRYGRFRASALRRS